MFNSNSKEHSNMNLFQIYGEEITKRSLLINSERLQISGLFLKTYSIYSLKNLLYHNYQPLFSECSVQGEIT